MTSKRRPARGACWRRAAARGLTRTALRVHPARAARPRCSRPPRTPPRWQVAPRAALLPPAAARLPGLIACPGRPLPAECSLSMLHWKSCLSFTERAGVLQRRLSAPRRAGRCRRGRGGRVSARLAHHARPARQHHGGRRRRPRRCARACCAQWLCGAAGMGDDDRSCGAIKSIRDKARPRSARVPDSSCAASEAQLVGGPAAWPGFV